jgi:peptidoglycan/LPS O-acetylase OafA/YrhL
MISLGATIYDLYCVLQNKGWYKRELLLQITEVVAFVAIIFFLLCPLNLDCLAVIFFCIFLLSILHKNAILEKIGRTKPFRDISKIEYAVYLNHAAIVLLFNRFVVRSLHVRVAVLLILLIVAVSLYSVTTTALMGKIRKRLFRM